MNAHTTQLLAEHRTNHLHAEADLVRLARLARMHGAGRDPNVVSRLLARIHAVGRRRQPAPSLATRHAD